MDRVCTRAIAKFAERMPYNVEGYFEGDMQRRHDIWESVKKLQKARGLDERNCLVQKVWEESEKS